MEIRSAQGLPIAELIFVIFSHYPSREAPLVNQVYRIPWQPISSEYARMRSFLIICLSVMFATISRNAAGTLSAAVKGKNKPNYYGARAADRSIHAAIERSSGVPGAHGSVRCLGLEFSQRLD